MAPPRKRTARYKTRAFGQYSWVEGYPLPQSKKLNPILEVGDKVIIRLMGWIPMSPDEVPETDPMTPTDARELTEILRLCREDVFTLMRKANARFDGTKKAVERVAAGIIAQSNECVAGPTWDDKYKALRARLGLR